MRLVKTHRLGAGVGPGNWIASAVLLMIYFVSIVAVILTILVPLHRAERNRRRSLMVTGSLYFALIGMGFMLAEWHYAVLQRFSRPPGLLAWRVPFSLILASGFGSLTSERLKLSTRGRLLVWSAGVVTYLVVMAQILPAVFQATTDRERLVRIGISLAAIMPLGFLLGFALPTGMRLVEAVDNDPTPWFWGINGAAGVLASVLGVIVSMSFGINVTLYISAICYLLLIPTGLALLAGIPKLFHRFL